MKAKTHYKALTVITAISLLLLNQCRPSGPKSLKFSREDTLKLVDSLGPSNVVTTPLTGIIEHFDLIEENTIDKTTLFRKLSTSKLNVWGVTTSRSILGKDEASPPEGMKIFLNDKPINFLEEQKENTVYWKWIETSKEIEIKYDDNYSNDFKCLVLDEDEHFSFETILPNAPVEFEVYTRVNWHPLDLNFFLDDQLLEVNAVGRDFSRFHINCRPEIGTHTITIKPSISKRLSQKKPIPPRLLVFQVKVKTQNDVILFFVPTETQSEFSLGKIKARYLSNQNESGNLNPYYDLYKILNDFTLDEYAQEENPENIKKKLDLENLSVDALMAPPGSRFEFKVTVPENCYLEFGSGIFSYKGIQNPEGAKFKILTEVKDKQTTLFEHELILKHKDLRNQIIFEKINLSEYANKKLKLIFLTENPEGKEQVPSEKLALSFWANPLIYRPVPDNLKMILISLDTLRADHLSCYGYSRLSSPNMDELARDSVLFENTYAQSSWTLPSHMSMLFSLNSASHQVYFYNQKVNSSVPSLASFLKKAGFITYAFTGGGYVSSVYGFSKGFDWYDEPVRGRMAPLGINEAENLFAYTSDWLKKNKDKAFFLFLHTFQIHGPYACPQPWNKMHVKENAPWDKISLMKFLEKNGEDYLFTREEKRNIIALYDGEISYTDATLIKPIVSLLKELNIYDNTLLIITSDHGEEFQDHGGWLHGKTLYNEMLRVPLLIKFPNSENKGSIIKHNSRLIDIMPTVLDVAGIKYNKNHLDGKSLLTLISGKEKEERVFISDLAHKTIPIPCPALIATNKNQLKLIITKSKEGIRYIETYYLTRDPREKHNIMSKGDKVREELIASLNKYYQRKKDVKKGKISIQLNKELEERLKALGYLH